MNCYDCSLTEYAERAAVAVCQCCGAALCTDHLRITRPVLHRLNGMGVAHGPAPARRVLCVSCQAALGTCLPTASTG